MAPILKEVAGQLGDRATILKVDVDRNPQAAAHYGIQGVPTLILFRKERSNGGSRAWCRAATETSNRTIRTIKLCDTQCYLCVTLCY